MTKAFLLDSDPDKTQEQREKEGHRLYITKDSFTETKKVEKNGKTSLETHTVSREKNPEIYEELLQDAASNFSSHFVFIPEDKAKELDLYQTNFRYTDGLRNYMREMAKPLDDAQKRVTKEMREMQGHEKDFMRWAIRQSDKETPGEILQEIKDNYRNLVSDFAMASHDEIDEKFHADPDKKGYKEPSEAIAVQSRAKHEAVDRRTEMLLQNNGRTLSDHLEDFVNTLTDERHIEVQTPPYWEQQKTILESMIGREESEKYQFNEKQLEERLEALEKGQQESLPGNSIRDTSDHREVNERYYDRLKEDTIKKTLEKHPGMSREDTKVQQFALQRAIVHDVMNMVRYNSEPVLGRDSIRAYNQLDAAIINASWNADGRAIQELTNRELEQHMDEIQKLASASSKAVAAEEKDFGRDDQERG